MTMAQIWGRDKFRIAQLIEKCFYRKMLLLKKRFSTVSGYYWIASLDTNS